MGQERFLAGKARRNVGPRTRMMAAAKTLCKIANVFSGFTTTTWAVLPSYGAVLMP